MTAVAVNRGLRSKSVPSIEAVDTRNTHLSDAHRRRRRSPVSPEERERRIAAARAAAGLPPLSSSSEFGRQQSLGSPSSSSSSDGGDKLTRRSIQGVPSLGALPSNRPRSASGTRTRSASKLATRPGSAVFVRTENAVRVREIVTAAASCDSGATTPTINDEATEQLEKSQPIVSNSSRAGILARMYRLPIHEVLRIAQELDALQDTESGHISHEDFQQWMYRVFDCSELDQHLVDDAMEVSLTQGRVNLNKFFAWYVQNMFFEINQLNSSSDRLASDSLVAEMARRYKMPAVTIDVVKREFDRYDRNKDALLDYSEFLEMVHAMLGANVGDLSEQRIQRFWSELDKYSKGAVEFSQFIAWFLKYFTVVGQHIRCCLVESFYESFKPDVQRRKFVIRNERIRRAACAGGA